MHHTLPWLWVFLLEVQYFCKFFFYPLFFWLSPTQSLGFCCMLVSWESLNISAIKVFLKWPWHTTPEFSCQHLPHWITFTCLLSGIPLEQMITWIWPDWEPNTRRRNRVTESKISPLTGKNWRICFWLKPNKTLIYCPWEKYKKFKMCDHFSSWTFISKEDSLMLINPSL